VAAPNGELRAPIGHLVIGAARILPLPILFTHPVFAGVSVTVGS